MNKVLFSIVRISVCRIRSYNESGACSLMGTRWSGISALGIFDGVSVQAK